ncbi:MAG: glycosyltransferase family 39 protein [Negativicutes bacterium]|nr:glycosyltransferase family 39 protein [Negativicutes bacterium]
MSERLGLGFLILTFVTALILFFNLGGVPLMDPDEPVYAETAREMIQFHDFLSPRIFGEYWYDKPPMYYWLTAGAFQLFGVNEFAARFPSALLALICALYVFYAGSRLFDARAGIMGALVLGTSIEFFYLGKAAVTDITLTLFLTVSLLSFLLKRYHWFYIGAALATVTKGPIGLLFPGAVVVLYLLAIRDFSELGKMKIPSGTLLYLVIALPWYLLMTQLHGSAFIDTFIGFHNITRFTSPEHPEGLLWYYFIPVLILGFLPWTAVMVQAVWKALYESREDSRKLIFLLIWAGFIFVFFSVSRTKLISYILPMYPPLAMVVGWYFNRISDWRYGSRPLSWPVLFTLLSALIWGGLYFGVKAMPELLAGAVAVAVLFGLMTVGVWYFVWRREIEKGFWLQVAAMTLFSMVLMTMLLPQAAPAFHSRDIAQAFAANYDGKSTVYVAKFLHPGFTFYSGVYGQELKPDEISKIVAGGEKAYLVLRSSDYDRLAPEQKQKLTTVATVDNKLLVLKP